jgi:hypothetical protein
MDFGYLVVRTLVRLMGRLPTPIGAVEERAFDSGLIYARYRTR